MNLWKNGVTCSFIQSLVENWEAKTVEEKYTVSSWQETHDVTRAQLFTARVRSAQQWVTRGPSNFLTNENSYSQFEDSITQQVPKRTQHS